MIKKILEDWNNRVGGNLNHKKESHLFELGSMLWEQGWSSEQIGELIKNLVEQESKFKGRSKETGKIRYFKDKESMDKAIEAGTVELVGTDTIKIIDTVVALLTDGEKYNTFYLKNLLLY